QRGQARPARRLTTQVLLRTCPCLTTSGHPQVPVQDRAVRVDSPVAQEWPVAAGVLDELRIAGRHEHLGLRARFSDLAPERIRDEGMAEELDTVRAGLVLVADAVWRGCVDAVRDRMCPLRRLPRVHLCGAELLLLGGMPADRRGVEDDVCAKQRGDARRLPIP